MMLKREITVWAALTIGSASVYRLIRGNVEFCMHVCRRPCQRRCQQGNGCLQRQGRTPRARVAAPLPPPRRRRVWGLIAQVRRAVAALSLGLALVLLP